MYDRGSLRIGESVDHRASIAAQDPSVGSRVHRLCWESQDLRDPRTSALSKFATDVRALAWSEKAVVSEKLSEDCAKHLCHVDERMA